MLRNLSEGEHTIKVTAVPKSSNIDKDNYADVYNAPADFMFKINVSASYIIPKVDFNPANVTMYTGTTEGAPDVLVTDGTNKIENTPQMGIVYTKFRKGRHGDRQTGGSKRRNR